MYKSNKVPHNLSPHLSQGSSKFEGQIFAQNVYEGQSSAILQERKYHGNVESSSLQELQQPIKQLDLSKRNLKEISDSLIGRELSLQRGYSKSSSNEDMRTPSLLEINLSENKLCAVSLSVQTGRNIIHLNLSRNRLIDLSVLQNLSKLKELNLAYNYLDSSQFDHIGYLRDLEILDISHNHLKEQRVIDVIESLPKLRIFLNNMNDYTEIFFTCSSAYLQHISLEGNSLSTLEFYKPKPSVTSLSVKNNNLSQIIGLENLENVEHINYFLKEVYNLKNIDAESNQLHSISSIPLSGVGVLNLASNKLNSLEFLVDYSQVQSLVFANNKLQSFPKFSMMLDTIMFLDLSKNALNDLFGMERFPNLIEFNLAYNSLPNLEMLLGELVKLQNLRVLDLRCNRFNSQFNFSEHFPSTASLKSLETIEQLIRPVQEDLFLEFAAYRSFVISNLTQSLFILDHIEITPYEFPDEEVFCEETSGFQMEKHSPFLLRQVSDEDHIYNPNNYASAPIDTTTSPYMHLNRSFNHSRQTNQIVLRNMEKENSFQNSLTNMRNSPSIQRGSHTSASKIRSDLVDVNSRALLRQNFDAGKNNLLNRFDNEVQYKQGNNQQVEEVSDAEEYLDEHFPYQHEKRWKKVCAGIEASQKLVEDLINTSACKDKKENNRSHSEIKMPKKVEKGHDKENSSASSRSKYSEETEPEVAEIVNRTNSKLKSILKEKKDIDGNAPEYDEYEFKTPHVPGKKRSGIYTKENSTAKKQEQKLEIRDNSEQQHKKRGNSMQMKPNDLQQQHIKHGGIADSEEKSDEMKDKHTRMNSEKLNLEDQASKLFGLVKNYIDEKLNQTFDKDKISNPLIATGNKKKPFNHYLQRHHESIDSYYEPSLANEDDHNKYSSLLDQRVLGQASQNPSTHKKGFNTSSKANQNIIRNQYINKSYATEKMSIPFNLLDAGHMDREIAKRNEVALHSSVLHYSNADLEDQDIKQNEFLSDDKILDLALSIYIKNLPQKRIFIHNTDFVNIFVELLSTMKIVTEKSELEELFDSIEDFIPKKITEQAFKDLIMLPQVMQFIQGKNAHLNQQFPSAQTFSNIVDNQEFQNMYSRENPLNFHSIEQSEGKQYFKGIDRNTQSIESHLNPISTPQQFSQFHSEYTIPQRMTATQKELDFTEIKPADFYGNELAELYAKISPHTVTPPRPIFNKEMQQSVLKEVLSSTSEYQLIDSILAHLGFNLIRVVKTYSHSQHVKFDKLLEENNLLKSLQYQFGKGGIQNRTLKSLQENDSLATATDNSIQFHNKVLLFHSAKPQNLSALVENPHGFKEVYREKPGKLLFSQNGNTCYEQYRTFLRKYALKGSHIEDQNASLFQAAQSKPKWRMLISNVFLGNCYVEKECNLEDFMYEAETRVVDLLKQGYSSIYFNKDELFLLLLSEQCVPVYLCEFLLEDQDY